MNIYFFSIAVCLIVALFGILLIVKGVRGYFKDRKELRKIKKINKVILRKMGKC